MPYNEQGSNQTNNAQYSTSENPVFQIKLRSLSNDNEQSNKLEKGPNSSKKVVFKVGDYIKGKAKNSDEFIEGRIVEFNVNSKKVVVISNKTKERITLDFSSIVSKVKNGNDKEKSKDVDENKNFILKNFSSYINS